MELHEEHANPLVALDAVFQDGAALRFPVKPPVQQARVMRDLGKLLAQWGVEFDLEFPVDALSKQFERAWQHGYSVLLSPLLSGEREWHDPGIVLYVYSPDPRRLDALARAESADGDHVKALRVALDFLEQAGWPISPPGEEHG